MTEHKSFKRLVRARMEKTGESYTAARANLLRGEKSGGIDEAALTTSDENIRRRTGRGWEEWFELLDRWGAAERTHRETARWVAAQQGAEPLAWNVQTVVAGYERARRIRAVGEKDDGFAISASKTIGVPVERLYDEFFDASAGDDQLQVRTATKPRSARFDWGEGGTRVNVTFLPKGEARSTIAVEHRRLADAGEAQRMKNYWRERISTLKDVLEGAAK
jgi:hypothetical protein